MVASRCFPLSVAVLQSISGLPWKLPSAQRSLKCCRLTGKGATDIEIRSKKLYQFQFVYGVERSIWIIITTESD